MRDETASKQDRSDAVNANVPWRVIDVRVLGDYVLAVRIRELRVFSEQLLKIHSLRFLGRPRDYYGVPLGWLVRNYFKRRMASNCS